jgi:hypothetical protein
MATKTVKFRIELEQPLPHPEEMAVVTFIGRATVKTGRFSGVSTLEPQITHLWMGIDIPSQEQFPWHVRPVSLPTATGSGWKRLRTELEQAALDAFDSPVAITLPDEVSKPFTAFVWGLQPSGIFQ